MSLRNYSDLIELSYKYIGYKKENKDLYIESKVKESLKELECISAFKYIYAEFTNLLDILNQKPYLEFLNNSTGYYIVATTLGIQVDKRISLLSKKDMAYMVIFNSCAAAYLEYLADNYEYNTFGSNISYRFCPGYSNTSTLDILELKKYLNLEKIGIEVFDSGMMLPEKSMFGIIAKDKNAKKTCNGCVIKDKCEYRKEKKTCYS